MSLTSWVCVVSQHILAGVRLGSRYYSKTTLGYLHTSNSESRGLRGNNWNAPKLLTAKKRVTDNAPMPV